MTLQILNKLGYHADVVANGLEVLESLKHQDYDIFLMDVRMPEMSGLEVASEIRKLWRDSQLKIIAITAYAFEGDREKCWMRGWMII